MSWLSEIVDAATGKRNPLKERVREVASNTQNTVRTGVQPIQRSAEEQRWNQLRGQREQDLERGRQRAERDFGEGKLGRIDQNRSGEVSDVLARRKQMADTAGQRYNPLVDRSRSIMEKGFSAPELAAARESRLRNMARLQQQQQRQLAGRQGQMGLRGGVAGAQFNDLLSNQGRESLQAEQELMLQQINRQDQAANALQQVLGLQEASETGQLSQYQDALGAARADELSREKYNLDQLRREALGRQVASLGEAGLGAAERGAVISADAAREAGRAMQSAGGGGKK